MSSAPRPASSALLAARSLLWVLLLPGLVAGYLPWRFFGFSASVFRELDLARGVGLAGIAVGTALLATCVWEFAHRGRGTLSPVDPPRHLVVNGLYRYVRNPMYVAVTLIVLGEAVAARSRGLGIYWVVWFVWVNVFVIGYEEPNLRRRFGVEYDAYTARVGRWIPRRRA